MLSDKNLLFFFFLYKGAAITEAERKICYSTQFFSSSEHSAYLNRSATLQLLGNVCCVSGV